MIPILDGFAPLAGRYDGFIVDLWGVMHDGAQVFPAALDCLTRLHGLNKRIVILSNAPRRVSAIQERNEQLGLPAALSHGVMSSGEDTWNHLARRPDDWYRALGTRCYHLGPERDFNMRAGLGGYSFADDLGAADFILMTGTLGTEETVGDYEDFLRTAAGHGLPMICANPDLEVIRDGKPEICAGAVAARYEAMGAEVRYHGKPHAGIYDACFDILEGVSRARIAAIGDSLRTDIAGANAVGIDGIFIMGGLQARDLGADDEGYAPPERLAAQCRAEGHTPAAALPVFRWSP